MKRYPKYKFILLLYVLLLSSILTACGTKSSYPAMKNLDSSSEPSVSPTVTDIQEPDDFYKPSPSPSPANNTNSDTISITSSAKEFSPSVTPTLSNTPPESEFSLQVHGSTISLGEDKDSIIKKLGYPNRIDATEYNFNYYIYNNDYSHLVFVAISKGVVVGFYTDSIDFNFNGICSGSSIAAVNESLGGNFSVAEVLVKRTQNYTIQVLMDQLASHRVTGIYVFPNNLKQEKYSESVVNNIELMVYDLTSSIRVRNKEAILSWSSSAALSARKHSVDMAENNFFNHISPIGRKPSERIRAEGIYFTTCGENIIAGYGTAILSAHSWFNSDGHRKNLLNDRFRYLGVGFVYRKDSQYKTYITQDFYR